MSRLWRDQIEVFLAPERVDLVRSARGFKPVQSAKVTVLCERVPGAVSYTHLTLPTSDLV